jgi:hypothetical protein
MRIGLIGSAVDSGVPPRNPRWLGPAHWAPALKAGTPTSSPPARPDQFIHGDQCRRQRVGW